MRSCPVCANKNPEFLDIITHNTDVKRVHCQMCGLVFIKENLYIRPTYNWEYCNHFKRPGDIRKAGALAGVIADILLQNFDNPQVLEIGPGNGLVSFDLKFMGFDVEIVDVDPTICCLVKDNFGIKSFVSSFEDFESPHRYDFIYAGHVVEHSENPLKFFENANKHLKQNGLFFFDTPDVHYSKRWGARWKHFKTRNPFEHCSLFSLKTIKLISKITSFKVESLISLPEFESMQALLRKE